MIDLHCHTRRSDSSMGIKDILSLAEKSNITHLAITDHDTTLGINEALSMGKEFNVEVIPGIEISAWDYKSSKVVHILGYFIDFNSSLLREICNPIIKVRNEISREVINNLNKEGYLVHWEEVKSYAVGSSCVNKRHIMYALKKKGYSNSAYYDAYNKLILKIPNAKKYVEVETAIKGILYAGGVPVLAHPGVFNNFESIASWKHIGLQGIEVEHPSHSLEDKKLCRYFSEKFHLIETGGSDFHGVFGKRNCTLGCNNLGVDAINKLKIRSEKNKLNLEVI